MGRYHCCVASWRLVSFVNLQEQTVVIDVSCIHNIKVNDLSANQIGIDGTKWNKEKRLCHMKNEHLICGDIDYNSHFVGWIRRKKDKEWKKKCVFNDSKASFAFRHSNDKLNGSDKDISLFCISWMVRIWLQNQWIHWTERNGFVKCPVVCLDCELELRAYINANFIQINFKWIIQLNGKG